MKYFSLAVLLLLISCEKKEIVLLPKSNKTIVKYLEDVSPVYVFFRTNGKDTLAEVNRKNTIGTTNWIFNIDRRLPLRLVIPEILKLQSRKKNGMHENPSAGNYFSYADTIGKNLAFLPFTNVNYHMNEPKTTIVFFDGRNRWKIGSQIVTKDELRLYFKNNSNVVLGFDRNTSYGNYIEAKIFIADLINSKAVLPQTVEYCF